MRIYRSLAETPPDFGPSALTIGNFDGVHVGHRRILRRLKALADERGWKASVLTFDPHPSRVVAPERSPRLMTSPEQRAGLMAEEGVEQVLILPFTPELARLPAEEFVRELVVGRLGARAVMVGGNFHFGYRQSGDIRVLQDLGQQLGFETVIVPPVEWRGATVSSSRIRELIRTGQVSLAARCLERAYRLEGPVVSGRGVGSKQTVPTLNLAPEQECIPANGVYVTHTRDLDGERSWESITNVGYRPTFGASDELSIETFLLGPRPLRPLPYGHGSDTGPSGGGDPGVSDGGDSGLSRTANSGLNRGGDPGLSRSGDSGLSRSGDPGLSRSGDPGLSDGDPGLSRSGDPGLSGFAISGPSRGADSPLSRARQQAVADMGPLDGNPPRRIRVEFLWRVRDERKFATPEALRAQILKDVRAAENYFRRAKSWIGRVPCVSS